MSKMIDLTGYIFGRLTVIRRDYEKQSIFSSKEAYWLCKCDCGNLSSIRSHALRSGKTKSCGCISVEKVIERSKKFNKFDLNSKEYAIGYTVKGEEFYFNKEHYDRVKNLCWRFDNNGYVVTTINRKRILFHRYILDASNDIFIDHKNGVTKDNRINNLRIVTKAENCQNSKTRIDNTSGRKGVRQHTDDSSWGYEIQANGKRERKYGFKSFEDAVKAREEAEIRLHKEYRSYEFREDNK